MQIFQEVLCSVWKCLQNSSFQIIKTLSPVIKQSFSLWRLEKDVAALMVWKNMFCKTFSPRDIYSSTLPPKFDQELLQADAIEK